MNGGSTFVLVKDSGTYLNSKYLPRTRCGHKRPHELEACHSAYILEAGLDLMPFPPAKHRSWLSQIWYRSFSWPNLLLLPRPLLDAHCRSFIHKSVLILAEPYWIAIFTDAKPHDSWRRKSLTRDIVKRNFGGMEALDLDLGPELKINIIGKYGLCCTLSLWSYRYTLSRWQPGYQSVFWCGDRCAGRRWIMLERRVQLAIYLLCRVLIELFNQSTSASVT